MLVEDHEIDSIPGWFFPLDRQVFRFALVESRRQCEERDVVEIGCYLGKSAVLIGAYCEPSENLTVIDLFEQTVADEHNVEEVEREYSGLTEKSFLDNYSRFHDRAPEIIRGDSGSVSDRLASGAFRFVHVDGSHLYHKVASDIETSKRILAPQGIVAFDDFRSEHTPGVAAAVWNAVFHGLHVLAITPMKLYGTWGDPDPWRAALEQWLADAGIAVDRQVVGDEELIRLHR